MQISVSKLRKWNVALHRDLGYLLSVIILIYCVSGIAMNHSESWNPEFIMVKDTFSLPFLEKNTVVDTKVGIKLTKIIQEDEVRLIDSPLKGQYKLYFKDATFHVYCADKKGVYERITKRPLFYQANSLHKNSIVGWKWVSDVFGILLITITVSGLFVMKGKYGISGRGKWFISAGVVFPMVFLFIQILN